MNSAKPSTWDRAVAAYQAGRLDEAAALGREILSGSTGKVDALHLLSLIAFQRGDTDLELRHLDQILEIAPNHVEALNGKAAILRNRGKSADAIPLCQLALRIRPNYVNALNTLGVCYQQGGQSAEAAECFTKVIVLQPRLAAAHLNLGAVLERLGESSQASACYRRVLELAPGTPEAFESLGYLRLQEKRDEEAAESFSKALELRPNSPKMLIQLPEVKSQLGLTEEPITLLRRALALDPNSGRAHCLLGLRLQDLGQFDEATVAFQKSLELEPVQGEAYLGLFVGKKASPEDKAPVEQMARTLEESKLSPHERMQLNKALGKALDDLGEYGRAIAHVDASNRIATEEIRDVGMRFDPAFQARLVDDLIGAYTSEFFRSRQKSSLSTELPLLIVGMPRSGTTLLEQILSRHSQVEGAGELKFWGDAEASGRCAPEALAHEPDKAARLAESYVHLLTGIGPNAAFVTDKMPTNFLHMGAIHLLLPNARFIHCRRDPLDNGISLYMTPFRTRPPFTYSREDIVIFYRLYQKLMDHWHSVLPPDRILDLDYEEVVFDRERSVKRILEFLGLPWEAACLNPEESKRIVGTPSRWQTRQAVYTTSVERWRCYEPWLGAIRELKPV